MRTVVDVSLAQRSYPILIGEGLIRGRVDALQSLAAGRQVAVVTDAHVAPLYLGALMAQLREVAATTLEVIVPAGEASKDWPTLNRIFDLLLANAFDRGCLLVALGGGVVGDLTGFAAAVYQRGVEFVQVPTTLLAQVDSSVGGKTAINHPAGKNMIGAFHQPRMVLADVETLASLSARELSAGLAEMLKHGFIADLGYLERLEADLDRLLACDPQCLRVAVARSCEIKAAVVGADEREGGLRATLNFGHTFGHAIESGLGYGRWLHGEAVGAGMVMAADLSHRLGRLDTAGARRVAAAVAAARLPVRGPRWPAQRYVELMRVDKKAVQGVPKFVLLDGLGRAVVEKVPAPAVCATIDACVEPFDAAR